MKENGTIRESHDQGAKMVFEDPILCAEFLRDYVNLSILKNITPEQITNISSRFVSLWDEERNSEDFKKLEGIPSEYFEHLESHTPDYLLKLISTIVAVFLHRLNVPNEEVAGFTDLIMERRIGMLFDSFEAYDVQETRRLSREEGELSERQACILELLQELGKVPAELKARITGEADMDVLRYWLKLAAKVESIDEFKRKI